MDFLKRGLSALSARYRSTLVSPRTNAPDAPKKPSGHTVALEALKAALRSKDSVEIRRAAAKLVRASSVRPHAWKPVCTLLSNGRCWSDIVRYLSRTDGSWNEVPEILLIAGRAERHLGNYERSATLLAAAFDRASTTPVSVELAHLYLDTGQHERLAPHVALILRDKNGYNLTSTILRKLANKSKDDAIAVLHAATNNNPTNEHFKMLFPDILAQVGEHTEACQELSHLIELYPDDAQIGLRYMRSANVLQSDDYVAGAIAIGERHLQAKGLPPSLENSIATLLAHLYPRAPSAGEAEEGLDAIAARFQDNEKLLDIVSASYLRNANLAKSEQLTRRLLELNPNKEPEYAYRLAGVLAQRSRTSEALEALEIHIPEDQRDALYYARVGHLHVWSGDWRSAMPILSKAIKMDSGLSTALADLALCYDLQNDREPAFSLMKRAAVMAAIRPPKPTPGIEEFMPLRAKRRMWQLGLTAGRISFANGISKEILVQNRLTMPFPLRQWNRESLTGLRVIAIADNGIGDEIRFTTVYDRHFHDAASVMLTCDPRLLTLLRRSFPSYQVYPVQRVFPRLKKARTDVRRRPVAKNIRALVTDEVVDAAEDADVIVRCLDVFETTSYGNWDVATSNSLVADLGAREFYRLELLRRSKARPVIGLSWRGSHHSYSRDAHYFTLEQWKPFLDMEQFCFVNLQYMLRDDELAYLRETLGERFIEFPDLDLMNDFEGMAALCAELDHIVVICTTILELAGAVGCPILYLMRSPQITHSIRLAGEADEFGSYADNVWTSCRIIPKFEVTDGEAVEIGTRYLDRFYQDHNADSAVG